jgi:hypothetical protein
MSISVHPDTAHGPTPSSPPLVGAAPAEPSGTKVRSRLFTKYVALFVSVVGFALLSNGLVEVFLY